MSWASAVAREKAGGVGSRPDEALSCRWFLREQCRAGQELATASGV